MSASQPDMGSQFTEFEIVTETKLPLINSVGLAWTFFKSLLLHLNFLSFLLTPCFEFIQTVSSQPPLFPTKYFLSSLLLPFYGFHPQSKASNFPPLFFFPFLTCIHPSKHFIAILEALYFLRCTTQYAECSIHLSNVMKIILVLFSASKSIPNVNIIL